MVVWLRGNH